MSEKSLWVRMRAKLAGYGHFERVENGAGVGTPDVDFCVHGVEGKIELKYLEAFPVRSSPKLLGRKGLRAEQAVWISRRCRHHGRVFVLIGVGRHDLFLLRMTPDLAARLNELTLEQVVEECCWSWRNGGNRPVPYHQMVLVLVG